MAPGEQNRDREGAARAGITVSSAEPTDLAADSTVIVPENEPDNVPENLFNENRNGHGNGNGRTKPKDRRKAKRRG